MIRQTITNPLKKHPEASTTTIEDASSYEKMPKKLLTIINKVDIIFFMIKQSKAIVVGLILRDFRGYWKRKVSQRRNGNFLITLLMICPYI